MCLLRGLVSLLLLAFLLLELEPKSHQLERASPLLLVFLPPGLACLRLELALLQRQEFPQPELLVFPSSHLQSSPHPSELLEL